MADSTEKNVGLIDVRPIYTGKEKENSVSFELAWEDYGFADVKLTSPVRVCAEIRRVAGGSHCNEGYTELKLSVSAEIVTICARCTEEIKETLEFVEVYGITESHVSDDSEDYISTEGGILNAYEAARTQFLLNFPERFLCRDDCRGICTACGKNLNNGDCDCEKKEIDPRLAVLKKLKFDE